MYLVGLTGGIGSGKSTVAARFASLGCDVIDADRIARDIVEPGEPALDALAKRFGRGILHPDGSLDRPALAAIVFHDEASRRDIDRITHPVIGARVAARIEELRAAGEGASGRIVVVDHPMLIETGQAGEYDAVVAVVAPEDVRVTRLRDQRGMAEADVRARIRVQTDDATRRSIATYVIENDGSTRELLRQVDQVYAQLADTAHASDT
jgi:dephospho-CoA kinase